MIRKTISIFSFVLVSIFYLQGQTVFLKRPQDSANSKKYESGNQIQELHSDIEGLLTNPDFSGAFIGVCVQSLETGEYFYNYNQTKNFIPASTNKIITTSAALEYLNPEFRYTTSVYLDGKVSINGEFEGNIIVRGSGDPTFSTYFYDNACSVLDSWAWKLDSSGIKSIKGNLIADDRYFDNVYYPPGWMLDDISYIYSPQIDALAVNDNKVDLFIKPGIKEGELGKIRIEPPNNYVRIMNSIKTVSQNDIAEINSARELKTNIIELTGSVAIDTAGKEETKVSVTIDNPTIFFLSLFKQSIEKANIRFRGALVNINDLNEKFNYTNNIPFCSHSSMFLKEIITVVNQRSHNLAAEMILKTIAKETTGYGSFTKGIEKIRKYLSKNGISPDNINIVDGSGLSRLNFISPKYQVTLLSSIYRSENRDILINSLALPGKDGTLKKRLTKSRAEKNVYAKTGSMNGISNICGYVRTRDNEFLAFSIMMNNFTVPESVAQNLQDLIIMRLASFSRKAN